MSTITQTRPDGVGGGQSSALAPVDWTGIAGQLLRVNALMRGAMALPTAEDRGTALIEAYRHADASDRYALFALVATIFSDGSLPEKAPKQ